MSDGARKRAGALGLVRMSIVGILSVGVAAGVPIGLYFGFHSIVNSRSFVMRTIQVDGNVRMSDGEVLAAAGLDVPRNVLTLSEREIERNVERLPWVRDAEVSVSRRDGTTIVVHEAELSAIAVSDSLYLLDADGSVIREWVPEDGLEVALLSGVSETRGEALDTRLVDEAMRLVSDADATLEVHGLSAREARYDVLHGWTLVLSDGAEVRLGTGRMAHRLARLSEVYEVVAADARSVQRIALDTDDLDRVAVRLSEATASLDGQTEGHGQ